jgi:hypothetical protein
MISSRLAMWTFVGFLLLIGAVADSKTQGTVASADGQGTTIKSEVQLVLIDVVVTSGNGRPVGGLPKDNFQITEDGQPQAIAAFEEHKDVPAARIPLPPMPPNVFTNYPTSKKTDSVNVFLLDALNTQNFDQAFVRGQMTIIFTKLQPRRTARGLRFSPWVRAYGWSAAFPTIPQRCWWR